MLRSVALYVAVALGLLLALATAEPARVRGADAPPVAFSAERAMADVAAIARAPHPIGSAENARVRDYLIGRLRSLGFSVEIYGAPAVDGGGRPNGAYPQTLVATRPGRNPALPPVAIMSHYDSVAGSPGAADDAAGVAASLEVARALAAAGPSERSLALIVTDGEEAGLFGAEAFFAGHPLAKRIGALLNLEARGSSGPAVMFETSPENGALVSRYAAAADRPHANSLMAWAYAHMPNSTDLTPAMKAGVRGLNIAFVGRPFDYHSATAIPANLDRASLQSMGDQSLTTVRDWLGAGPLPGKAPNRVFVDLMGYVLVHYPPWAGWLLLAAAGGLIVVSMRRMGLGAPRWPELLRGAGGFLLILVCGLLAVRFAGRIAPVGETFYQGRPVAAFALLLVGLSLFLAGFALLGIVANLVRGEGRRRVAIVAAALAIGACLLGGWDVASAVFAVVIAGLAWWLLARPTAPTALWGGSLIAGLVLTVVAQVLAPEIAFLFAWPLLAGAALAAATRLGAEPSPLHTALLVIGGALGVAWIAPLANLTFDGLGMQEPDVLAVFSTLAFLMLAPLAARTAVTWPGRLAAGLISGAGLIVILFVAFHDPASPRTPQPSHLIHITNPQTPQHSQAWIATTLQKPGPWTLGVLGKTAKPERFTGFASVPLLARPTSPGAGGTAPTVVARRQGARVVLDIAAPGAREVRLALKGAELKGLAFASLPVATPRPGEDGWTRLRWYAPRDGFTVAFDAPARTAAIDWKAAATFDYWPPGAEALPSRPATVMPWMNSDSSVVLAEGKVGW